MQAGIAGNGFLYQRWLQADDCKRLFLQLMRHIAQTFGKRGGSFQIRGFRQ